MNRSRTDGDILPRLLRALVIWGTLGPALLAATALVIRQAWPTPGETLLVLTTGVSVWMASHLRSHVARSAAAAAWGALLVLHGLPTPDRSLGGDFQFFYKGAQALFSDNRSPYSVSGRTAFPFPTFLIVRLLSLGDRLPLEQSFLLFVTLQFMVLGIGYVLLDRTARTEDPASSSGCPRRILQAAFLFHPALLSGIGVGNSGALAGAAVLWAVWSWRCGTGRRSLHAAAILLNLAWMIKPQLLMACLFFLCAWGWKSWQPGGRRSRAASIGVLLLPWAGAILAFSLLVSPSAIWSAYREFFGVAITWHTRIAESYPNNYALSAILAKAMAKGWDVPVSQSLPLLTVGIALPLILCNSAALSVGKPDSLRAFFPWLLASLFWTSLVWEWYFSLVLAAPLLMLALEPRPAGLAGDRFGLRLPLGVACTMVFSSALFVLGLILLYCHSHALRLREIEGASEGDRA